ncbi:hypothetical protein XaC1_216 [Xanthomonas phage XaC1]|nr:hypothetical protein XaC1_216 [Xanthomonas phage XaC1]
MKESAFKYFEDIIRMYNTNDFPKNFEYNGCNLDYDGICVAGNTNTLGEHYTSDRIKFFNNCGNGIYEELKPLISFKDDTITGIYLKEDSDEIDYEVPIDNEADWFNIITSVQGYAISYDEILRIREIIQKCDSFIEIRYGFGEEEEYGY